MNCIARTLLAGLCLLAHGATAADAAAVPEAYAESSAIMAFSPDNEAAIVVRIAQYPARERAALWIWAYIDGDYFIVVDEEVSMVDWDNVSVDAHSGTFAVTGSSSSARMQTQALGADSMRTRLSASGLLHRTANPPPGPGTVPVRIDARFSAAHEPVIVLPGRLEVMGRVTASVEIAARKYEFALLGKWHEQTGRRPAFAPAFTYLTLMNEERGLLALNLEQMSFGYLFADGGISLIDRMEIDPYGTRERAFDIRFADGRSIEGALQVLREMSLPIEGDRRPGSTVVAHSPQGTLTGFVNDWSPEGEASSAEVPDS